MVQFADGDPTQLPGSVWGQVVNAGAFQTLSNRVTLVEAMPLAFGGYVDVNTTAGQALARSYLQAVANGTYDSVYRQAGALIRDGGFPDAILRLGWEFDGGWYPWSSRGNCDMWQAAFRHVHDVFASVSPSFRFDWNATSAYLPANAQCAWPGDNYVDIVGLNYYDKGVPVAYDPVNQTWVDQNGAFSSSVLPNLVFQRDFAIAHGKMVSYPEWALASGGTEGRGGGDDPAFIQGMYDWMNGLPDSGPGSLAYQSYFNVDTPNDGFHALSHFPKSQALYRQLFGPTAAGPVAPPAAPSLPPAAPSPPPAAPSLPPPAAPTVPPITPPVNLPPQVFQAEQSNTNLPAENVWPGYHGSGALCCWGTQGQYLTFTFNVPSAGMTALGVRYSSGNSDSYRRIELDGSLIAGRQTFAKTPNWSTWSVLSLNRSLSAGSHSLKIWFDAPSGSANYPNIDELTVDDQA